MRKPGFIKTNDRTPILFIGSKSLAKQLSFFSIRFGMLKWFFYSSPLFFSTHAKCTSGLPPISERLHIDKHLDIIISSLILSIFNFVAGLQRFFWGSSFFVHLTRVAMHTSKRFAVLAKLNTSLSFIKSAFFRKSNEYVISHPFNAVHWKYTSFIRFSL